MRLALLALLLTPLAAAAQEAVMTSDVRFDRVEVDLPHPEVQALAQDRDGLVWIGTPGGLGRYDGLGLTVLRHDPDDPRSLPSSDVRALLVGRDGVLWVGTDRGAARHDVRTDTFRRVAPREGACSGRVTWLAENGAGRLLFGSRTLGVCRLDRRTGRVERVAFPWQPDRDDRAWAFQGLPDGSAWVLGRAPGAACRIDAGGETCRQIQLSGFVPRILGLDAEGRLLAYGRALGDGPRELRRWSRGRFLPIAPDLPEFGWTEGAPVVAVGREAWLATATNGVLAVGLEDGAWRWLAPSPGDPASLPAHRVGALLVDRQGGAWVGTARGLAVWRPPVRPFTVYRRFSGRSGEISDDRVNGMAEARSGALWVTTNDGLNRLDLESDQFETFRIPETQSQGPPAWAPAPDDPYRDAWWQVLEGADGTQWVGGKRNGLFRLDPRTGLFRREAAASRALGLMASDGTPRGFGTRHIYEDASGHLWLGTTGEGLAVRHPDGRWEGVRPAPGDSTLPHPSVNRFYEDAAGRLWIGTDAGLARVRHTEAGHDMTFDPVDLGEPAPVWAIAESAATPGQLWVGTVGSGLVRYDPDTGATEQFSTEEGLPSELVYGVLTDDAGRVWASTSRGLGRLDPPTGLVTVYDEANGLHDDAFDLMAFYRSPTTGELWFGGSNGITRVDPGGAGVAAYRPPVAFTAVHVFDDVLAGRPLDGDTLRVAHDENFLTVQFAALDFTAPRQLRYRYRLVGVDGGWRETTGERPFATYTALAPGTYRLEVVGSNADGVFNEAPAVLTIVVEPAWWQGLPARALAVLGLALLGLGGVFAVFHVAARTGRREQIAVAADLHAGPVRGIGQIGRDLAAVEADGEVVRRVRDRVGEVETGLHDALLRLQPAAAGRLELTRALDATVRRFRLAAPEVAIHSDWSDAPSGLAEDVQRDLVAVAANLIAHTLRSGTARELHVSVGACDGAAGLRVAADGPVPVRTTALRGRLPGQKNGLVQALRTVRARGGSLDVEQTDDGSAVVVRLDTGGRRATDDGPQAPGG